MRTAWVTIVFIVINIIVFVGPQGMAGPSSADQGFILEFAAVPCEVVTGDGITALEWEALATRGNDLSLIHI